MSAASPARDERLFVCLVLLGGLLLRLVWLVQVNGPIDVFYGTGEATNVAIAIARGRGIADAYFVGSGPTAHLLPLSPALAALPIRLFGIGSASAILLLAWSLIQTAGAYLLWRSLLVRLNGDPLVARWGLALLCLLPAFVPQETIDFRFWEGAGALCLAAVNLLLIQRFTADGGFGWRRTMIVATLTALTFFYCPPVGLAVDACWAWFAFRRLSLRHAMRFAAVAGVALALLLAPWAARNARELGQPVPIRSNFGLELAIADHPAAVSGVDPAKVFADRMLEIHPYQKLGEGRAALQAAGGEVAYSRDLGHRTWQWIGAHPAEFARLTLRHLRQFFFPQPWQMYFSGWEGMREARAMTIALVNLLGLIGLAIGLYQRRHGYALLAIYIGVLALPYSLFQPMARYIYLIYPPLAFLAIDAFIQLRGYLADRPGWAR